MALNRSCKVAPWFSTLARSFFNSFNTLVSIVRLFNTYGSRQSARAIIPTVITQLLSSSSKIKLGSLHPTRDFNYINDTVAGFIAVAENANSIGKVISIGSGFEISIKELVLLIADIMEVDVEIESELMRVRPA